VRTSFAMTINKSPGQSLERVGVWLEESVFSHGQLYVACSRVGDPSNLKFSIKKNNDIAGAMPWLYMPVIFAALGMTCPAWTFPENDLPQQWDDWPIIETRVSTYSTAFESDQPAIEEFLEDNFDTPSRDHLTVDAQDHLIHDHYSHVPAVALAAQEMQEWAIEQHERHW
jgi:hypothetical protein